MQLHHFRDDIIEFDNHANLRFRFWGKAGVDIAVSSDPEAATWSFTKNSIDDLIGALEVLQEELRERESESEGEELAAVYPEYEVADLFEDP